MLQSISWHEYTSTLIVAVLLYYVYVGYKFFRWEILALLGITKIDNGVNPTALSVSEIKEKAIVSDHKTYQPQTLHIENIAATSRAFKDEVTAYLQGTEPTIIKPEMLTDLRLLFRKYESLRDSESFQELNSFIATEIQNFNGLSVTIDEIEGLWF